MMMWCSCVVMLTWYHVLFVMWCWCWCDVDVMWCWCDDMLMRRWCDVTWYDVEDVMLMCINVILMSTWCWCEFWCWWWWWCCADDAMFSFFLRQPQCHHTMGKIDLTESMRKMIGFEIENAKKRHQTLAIRRVLLTIGWQSLTISWQSLICITWSCWQSVFLKETYLRKYK